MKNEVKHTAHSSYRCEYHLVFAPKYRRKVIYKALHKDIIEIIKKKSYEKVNVIIVSGKRSGCVRPKRERQHRQPPRGDGDWPLHDSKGGPHADYPDKSGEAECL